MATAEPQLETPDLAPVIWLVDAPATKRHVVFHLLRWWWVTWWGWGVNGTEVYQ